MRATIIRRGLFVAAGSALVLALLPAAPALADPGCGAVVVANVTLTADLVCAGNALVIGADSLTINLAGHTISGNGTGTAINDNSHPGLTVRNGTISGFATGISLFGLTGATVTNMTIRDGRALFANIANDVAVSASEFRSTNVRFQSNSRRGTFTDVLFRGTTLALSESNNAKITRGDLLDSVVDSFESDAAIVSDSSFIRSSLTYRVASRNWQVRDSIFTGVPIGLTVGSASPGGLITGNTFVGNSIGLQISTTTLAEIDSTTVTENTFVNNGAAGMLFQASMITGSVPATPTFKVEQNRFIHNGFNPGGRTDRLGRPLHDGLHTATPAGSQIFIANTATVNNAQYGIAADPGTVVDGGGNESIADPLGCTGVVCA